MKEPPLWEDIQDVRENWHDPEYRRGFFIGLASTIWRLPVYGLIGLAVGYGLSRLFR
jgi:hypothetical protein